MKDYIFKLKMYVKKVLKLKEEYVMMDRLTGQLVVHDTVNNTFTDGKNTISGKHIPNNVIKITMECLGRL